MNPRRRSTGGSITCPATVSGTHATSRSSPWFSDRSSYSFLSRLKNAAGSGPRNDFGLSGRRLVLEPADFHRPAGGDRSQIPFPGFGGPAHIDQGGAL